MGRGYNPDLVNYKDSEYHYGSDFEGDDDDEAVDGGVTDTDQSSSEDSDDLDESRLSDDMKPESDVELEPNLEEGGGDASTPVPFWLMEEEEQGGDDDTTDEKHGGGRPPALNLPESSADLALAPEYCLSALTVYEALRQFSVILRLSPFRLEDFFAALRAEEEQANLLSEIHICLMKVGGSF